MADWPGQEQAAREAMAYASRAGDRDRRLQALRMLALAQVMQRNFEAGKALAWQGLPESRSLGLRGVEARLLNVLSIAAALEDDMVACLDLDQQAQQAVSGIGDRASEAIVMTNVGNYALELGDLEQGQHGLEAGLAMLRSVGDRMMESMATLFLSGLALWQGDPARAQALALSALELAYLSQARELQLKAGIRLGNAELALGNADAARQAFTKVRLRALELDNGNQHDASAGLARVALAEGDTSAAMAALQPLFDHVAAGGTLNSTDLPRQIEWTCYQALTCAGDPRAVDWLNRAHAALMAQADAISRHNRYASMREGYLNNIPYHREILAAWATRPHQVSASGTS
jgi:hypothetical protein